MTNRQWQLLDDITTVRLHKARTNSKQVKKAFGRLQYILDAWYKADQPIKKPRSEYDYRGILS